MGTHRRAEGHVEYIIITFVIMVCALVSFFSMINNIKIIADDLKICSDCPDGKTPEAKSMTVPTADDATKTGEGDGTDGDGSSTNPQPSPYPNWLADIMAWFSGARWFWDYALA